MPHQNIAQLLLVGNARAGVIFMLHHSQAAAVDRVEVHRFTIPTDFPESDGTLEWDRTTIVVVEVSGGGMQGIGYTYADTATATLIHDTLAPYIKGMNAMSPPAVYIAMWRRLRNLGRPGICSMAISAVDCAIWDLKARLLGVPLVALLGQVRDAAPIYGSGGFTSYSDRQLAKQLTGWVSQGIPRVKMKIGRDAKRDLERVRVARNAIGREPELYVDANGAYSRKQAIVQAEKFSEFGVRWFEEPVSSDDLEGLRLIRDRAPAIMDIAAGEYGYDIFYFRNMLRLERLTFSRPILLAAAELPAFCKLPRCARRTTFRFPAIRRRRCTPTWHVP